jgi:hypothetical protein
LEITTTLIANGTANRFFSGWLQLSAYERYIQGRLLFGIKFAAIGLFELAFGCFDLSVFKRPSGFGGRRPHKVVANICATVGAETHSRILSIVAARRSA